MRPLPLRRLAAFAVGSFAISLSACASRAEDRAATASDTQDLTGEFSDLSKADISFPQDPSRPLTIDDVTVSKGFDGRTPEEVAQIVRANFQGTIHPSREAFVHQQTIDVHKRWTLVIANAFSENFPASKFVQTVASEGTSLFIVATPRGEIFLQTTNPEDGEQWYIAKGNSFEPMAVASGFKPFTPPIARAELRLDPPGIRVEYPTWKWAALGQGATITDDANDTSP